MAPWDLPDIPLDPPPRGGGGSFFRIRPKGPKGWGEQPDNTLFIPRLFQLFSTAFCLLGRVLLILSGFRLPSFVGQTRKLLRFHLKSCFAGQTLGFTQVLMRKQECGCAFLTLKL